MQLQSYDDHDVERAKENRELFGNYDNSLYESDDGFAIPLNILKELVDKTIPIKPTMLPYKGFDGEVASYQGCPNCTIPITNVFTSREYKPKFCQECGREFDWSKDE